MSNILLCAPNFIFSTFSPAVYSNGAWEVNDYLSNLTDEFFVNKAISIDDALTSTILDVDFGTNRDVRMVGIPDSNVSKDDGQIIVEGALDVSWEGVTITGVNSTGATTINVTASGQAYILTGQGLTIAGDTQVYQVTVGVSLGSNLIKQSEAVDDSAWTKTNVTVTADDKIAPDNAQTMDKIVEDSTASAVHDYEQSIPGLTGGEVQTVSIFMQAAERTKARLTLEGTVFAGEDLDIDLSAGTISDGATAPIASSIKIIPDTTIYRITISAQAAINGSGILRVSLRDAAGDVSYTGDGASGLHVWGHQMVEDVNPLRYVKSGASIVVDSAGDITIERADSDTVGLAVATTGAEVVTCRSGDFITSKTFTSGLIDYAPIVSETGDKLWGQAGLWDGKESPETSFETNMPNQFLHINDAVRYGRYFRCTIRDTNNDDGFVSINALYVTSAYQPTRNMSFGAELGTASNSTVEKSAGGVTASNEEVGRRFLTFTLENIPLQEAWTNSFDLNRQLDITESFYVIYDPDATTLLSRQSFPAQFVTAKCLPHWTHHHYMIQLPRNPSDLNDNGGWYGHHLCFL